MRRRRQRLEERTFWVVRPCDEWAEGSRKRAAMRLNLCHLFNSAPRHVQCAAHLRLSRGWSAWVERTFAAWRAQSSTAPLLLARTLAPLALALRHLLRRELARGWNRWHGPWLGRRRRRAAMRRALRHLTARCCGRACAAWAERTGAERLAARLWASRFRARRVLQLGFAALRPAPPSRTADPTSRAIDHWRGCLLWRGWIKWAS